MNLADFSAISNGTYNLGSIRLQGEGDQVSLVKINNHRWLANNVPDDAAENARVRQALCAAIRQEAGIPQDVIDRLVGDLTSAEHLNQPLERRNVRSVLQQIGESRLKDADVHVKFSGKPKLNTALAMTALACLPQNGKRQELARMIVSAAATAFEKGGLKLDKSFPTEARVQAFRTMFENVDLRDMPTDVELRAMTPEDFFAACENAFDRVAARLREHTADVLFPGHSLFSKFRADTDWDTSDMHDQQMLMAGLVGSGIFSPGDLATLKNGVREFSPANLPSLKIVMDSRIGGWLDDFSEMSVAQADAKAEQKIGKDITESRIHGEFRFSVRNDEEFMTCGGRDNSSEAFSACRNWIKTKVDKMSTTPRQAAATKLLLTQEPLQPFREFAHMLGLTEYDEHTGFNYYLSENEDGSLKLEIKKDFTDYGDRNISASFSWRIEQNGTATMEDFKVKLPR